jgi:hypothetical protein
MSDRGKLGQDRYVRIVDKDGNQIGDTGSTPLEVNVKDSANITVEQPDLYTTFTDILRELKKMNIQLSIMTDNLVTNQDVEV